MLTILPNLPDLLPTGIVITNQVLDVLYMNANAVKLLSKERQQLESLKNLIFSTTEHRPLEMQECIHDMAATPNSELRKTVVLHMSDHSRLVYVSVRELIENQSKFYVFCLTDITDEKDCLLPESFPSASTIAARLQTRIIGHDEKIMEIFRLIEYAADSQANVLIQGESGTGKELVAEAIHNLSERRTKPLIKVNCAAISETLLESELFGHVKGSFTGAYKDKAGKFELANQGTIFLDEIGEISQAIQVKLLRVIQEKTIERVGSNRPVKVDMRIISATNRDLRDLMNKGLFREDLFYRLNVFSIQMPALRQRKLDIPLLVEHFIAKFNASTGKKIKGLSRKTMLLMMNYNWPGNIRELQNAIEHGFVLVKGNTIEVNDIPNEIRKFEPVKQPSGIWELDQTTENQPTDQNQITKRKTGRLIITKTDLEKVLNANKWNQTRTAEYLGISRVALWKKLKKHGLSL